MLMAMSMAGCAKHVSPPVEQSGNTTSPALPAATIAAQDEVNDYFYQHVLAQVVPCWKNLKGTGVVEFKYAFRPGDKQWQADAVTVEKSTLTEEDVTTATHCMQEAVKGTTLATKADVSTAHGLAVYWEWPVPLPESAPTAIPLRISTGGGGDRTCNKCLPEACPDNMCPKRDACSGHTTCTVTNSGDGTAQCNFSKADICTQGFYGFSGGRLFIY